MSRINVQEFGWTDEYKIDLHLGEEKQVGKQRNNELKRYLTCTLSHPTQMKCGRWIKSELSLAGRRIDFARGVGIEIDKG